MTSFSIIESNGNGDYKKKAVLSQDNHVFKGLCYGRKAQKSGLQSRAGVGSP